MLFVVLGIWAVCAVATAVIYERNDRSAAIGCLGGALLGPLGLILALISGVKGRPCPSCGETVRATATVCRHCHHVIPTH